MNQIIDIYKDLLDETDIASSICKYVANSNSGFEYDFGSTIIPKGTKLFRIRAYNRETDFSSPKEWEPSPSRKQNRCNLEGETAIYLGSSELICLLETHIPKGDQYVLGEYTVTKDIRVGGFIYVSLKESEWKEIVGNAYNAFLIAPVRNKDNNEMYKYIDLSFSDSAFSDIDITSLRENKPTLPYRFGRLIRSENYYSFTNMLTSIIQRRYPMGIRYSSCYIPLEAAGIQCSDYNVVLYATALGCISFDQFSIKINTITATPKDIAIKLLGCE